MTDNDGLCIGLGGGGAITPWGGGDAAMRGGGGDVGEEGAVLELDEVLLDEVLGVVVEDDAEETVELESEVGGAGGGCCIVAAAVDCWCRCKLEIVRL